MFLYPALTYNEYKIKNKTLRVIGEYHLSPDFKLKPKDNAVLIKDFVLQKMDDRKNGVYLEVLPLFNTQDRIKFNKEKLNKYGSINIQDVANSISNDDISSRVYGMDYRRLYTNPIHNRLQDTIYSRNCMTIPPNYLVTLLERIVNDMNEFKKAKWNNLPIPGIIQNMEKNIEKFGYILHILKQVKKLNEIRSCDKMIKELHKMLADVTDFFMLRDILSRDETTVTILIGNEHAKQLNLSLSDNIIYPPSKNSPRYDKFRMMGLKVDQFGKNYDKNILIKGYTRL